MAWYNEQFSPEANQGLLSFGLGLLANSRGQSTSEALGRAGMMGLQAYQGAKDQKHNDKLRSMQMAQAEEQDRIRKLQASAMQGATTGAQDATPAFKGAPGLLAEPGKIDFQKYQGLLAQGGDVQGALGVQSLLAKENRAPSIVPNGATAIDPATGRVIYTSPKEFGPTAQPAPSDLGKLVQEMQALPPNSPMRQSYMDRIKAIAAPPDQSVPVTYQQDASGSYVALPGKVPQGQTPVPMPTGVTALPKPVTPVKPTAQQTADQTRQRDANDALSVIAEAQGLLKQSTGSLLGTGIDKAAGAIGISTDGAKAGARLKALEGMLVSKMPKMSGPQSDKDVLLYKQMAGMIGDTTQPIETRMAALETVKKLQQQYAGAPSSAPSGKQVSRTGMHNGRKVIQYSDGSIEYAQ
ncbi:MAG: hypothetical protein RL758_1296 [Pseudomonadota bacterium]|jgi:hypothetical protein